MLCVAVVTVFVALAGGHAARPLTFRLLIDRVLQKTAFLTRPWVPEHRNRASFNTVCMNARGKDWSGREDGPSACPRCARRYEPPASASRRQFDTRLLSRAYQNNTNQNNHIRSRSITLDHVTSRWITFAVWQNCGSDTELNRPRNPSNLGDKQEFTSHNLITLPTPRILARCVNRGVRAAACWVRIRNHVVDLNPGLTVLLQPGNDPS